MHPSITLMDGVAQNAQYPDTFHIPTDMEKLAVRPGDHVKLGFINPHITERMWVRVTGEGVGILDNDPKFTRIECGDEVKFEPHHILSIILKKE